jgi:hypothetical protein
MSNKTYRVISVTVIVSLVMVACTSTPIVRSPVSITPLASALPTIDRRLTRQAEATATVQVQQGAEATANAQATSTAAVKATADTFTSTYGIAASFTDDSNYGAIAVHQNGERLVAMTDTDASGILRKVTGAVWLSPHDDAFVVYNGVDGLPERAVFGDYIILFLNYSANSVDVALISPDGLIEVTNDVQVDPEHLSQLQARRSSVGVLASPSNIPYQGDGLTLVSTLRLAALAVSVASCVTAVILSAGIALPCAAAVVSAAILLLPEDNVALSATSKSLGTIGCGVLDTGSCISLALDVTADVASLSDQTLESRETAINRTEFSLEIVGVWSVEIDRDCDGDPAHGTFVFSVDKIVANAVSESGKSFTHESKWNLSGNEITFSFPFKEGAGQADYVGTVAGIEIVGTMTNTEGVTACWVGKRIKP